MIANWDLIETQTWVQQDLSPPWKVALSAFGDATHLRLECEGEWTVPGGPPKVKCGPDGLTLRPLAAELLLAPAPWGCVIAKIGGSSCMAAGARKPDPPDAAAGGGTAAAGLAEDTPFAVGSYCIVALPAKTEGPLFVALNLRARPVLIEKLEIRIFGGKALAASGG